MEPLRFEGSRDMCSRPKKNMYMSNLSNSGIQTLHSYGKVMSTGNLMKSGIQMESYASSNAERSAGR
eukprot:5577011-Amphidinium_carterae.1